MRILDLLKTIDKIYSANPCELEEIYLAEKKLGFEFQMNIMIYQKNMAQ